MKLYLAQNVFDAALARIHRLFDEFEHLTVNFSGGKDSTVLLNLALIVAEERGRLPLKVTFIDQEAEWDTVITYIRQVMNDPRVQPQWLQVPFRLSNSTSSSDPWLHCWKEGETWLRPKEPNSIHENVYGTDRFAELFGAIFKHDYPNVRACHLAGVRCEESPARLQGLTAYATYKDITWGNKEDARRGHYVFYPLYDWSYTDIWKAIHDHGWPYCPLYDAMYQHGVPILKMRVSSVHHETALNSLTFLQEIEPAMWNRITARVRGVNAVNQAHEAYKVPSELPFMFASWQEYRDYLVENLIVHEDQRVIYRKQFASYDRRFLPVIHEKMHKVQIAALLANDYHETKLSTFTAAHGKYLISKGRLADRFSNPANRTPAS